mmetsp:Transcript_48028/g.104684  ORF Transcript_48028/g.104684 Transcript_48028/m.104684 type:complete len:174 (-) Transcript_48028:1-522(-)
MQQKWSARPGDVFVVSNYPIWGAGRLLAALVEGYEDPWDQNRGMPPCEPVASMLGVDQWIRHVNGWTGRRCFKTLSPVPGLFPCRYPFEGEHKPKIIVLVADPRHYITMMWQTLKAGLGPNIQFTQVLEQFLGARGDFFLGDWIEYLAAWSSEAARHPDTVHLANMGRLGSRH